MPELDGLETTRLIRQHEGMTNSHVPIISMTAHAMKGDEERCLAAGMDAHLTKPVSSQALFAFTNYFRELGMPDANQMNRAYSPNGSEAPSQAL